MMGDMLNTSNGHDPSLFASTMASSIASSSSKSVSSYDILVEQDLPVSEALDNQQHHSAAADIIVIGAGIAGCALAYSLSHTGHNVLLVERDLSPPDRIVGELLQPGGVAALRALGMADCLDGIDATPVEGYCVYMSGKQVAIPYPTLEEMEKRVQNSGNGGDSGLYANQKSWSKSGKCEGRSFHHGRFINALRQKVLHQAPRVTVLEGTVKDLLTCDHTTRVIGVKVGLKSSGESKHFYAPLTIVADGCFSRFRTVLTEDPAGGSHQVARKPRVTSPIADMSTKSHFVGLVLKNVDLPQAHCGTVCLTPQGPVLLYQIGDEARETRLLVDVKGKLPSIADGSLKSFIETQYLPHLPPSTHKAIETSLANDRLRSMPNTFLPPKMQGRRSGRRGVIMVGDSWNMRHPLTGGGMTVAFNDAVLLTRYLTPSKTENDGGIVDLYDWEEIRGRLQTWYWERKNVASVVNILSIALYDLFGADDANLSVLRDGCFKYFERGGECVAGPVGLLSAITPRPVMLFYHFFAVALYSIYLLYTQPIGTRKVTPTVLDYPSITVEAVRVFYTACVVILPVIFSEIWV